MPSSALCALLQLLAVAAGAPEHPAGSLAQTQLMAERFAARFQHVAPSMADGLEDLYAADLVFRDPITSLTGREAMRDYLRHFGATAEGARFIVTDTVLTPGNAVVFWTMIPAGGGAGIDGVSHLRVAERIREERDYFDLGQVYDQVPVLAWLTSLVKLRLAP